MHEASLASAVVQAMREHGLVGSRVRLVVSGGHSEIAAFDEALRFHMTSVDHAIDPDMLEIVHEPAERPCLGCGEAFTSVELVATCSRCGGVGFSQPQPERIKLQSIRPARGGGSRAARPIDDEAGLDVGHEPHAPRSRPGRPHAHEAIPVTTGRSFATRHDDDGRGPD